MGVEEQQNSHSKAAQAESFGLLRQGLIVLTLEFTWSLSLC